MTDIEAKLEDCTFHEFFKQSCKEKNKLLKIENVVDKVDNV